MPFRRWFGRHPAMAGILRPLYWLPIPIFVVQYCGTLKTVNGRSMQPTLNPDSSPWRDLVLFDRFSIGTLGNWNREDIVALRSPINPEQLLVKRIVALEGDTVKTLPPYPDAEVTVPEGHIWVEGDNYRTEDSNLFGPVPLALLDSKLTYIVWPLNRSGPLEQPTIPTLLKGGSRGPTWSHKMAEIERIQSRRARVTIAEAPQERISPAAEVQSWYQEKLAWIIGMDARRP